MIEIKNISSCLGCMPLTGGYGPICPQKALYLLQKAFDSGIRYFDTASNYGSGQNEKLLGQAFSCIRDQVYLSTKVGVRQTLGKYSIDGSKKYIKEALHESLKRLNTSYIDLLFYHHLDSNVPIEDTILAMKDLVNEGLVKEIGLFEMEKDILERALKIHPIKAFQAEYSLISRGVERSILPFCKTHNIRFIANAPLARGLLTSHPKLKVQPLDIRSMIPRTSSPQLEENIESLKKLRSFALNHHMSLQELSLAFLASQDVIVLFGTTSEKHLTQNLNALKHKLGADILEKLRHVLGTIVIKGDRIPADLKNLYLRY